MLQQEPKNQRNQVKIRYGSNSIERDFAPGTTVDDILADCNVLGALSAPPDVYAVSQGVTLDGTDELELYSIITLEKRGSSKA